MSSYFVNPLYSKYKAAAAAAAAAGEAINPTYYDCHFAPEVGGRHAAAAAALQLYGNSAASPLRRDCLSRGAREVLRIR